MSPVSPIKNRKDFKDATCLLLVILLSLNKTSESVIILF